MSEVLDTYWQSYTQSLNHFQQVCVLTYKGPGTMLSAGQKPSEFQAQEECCLRVILPSAPCWASVSSKHKQQLRFLRAVSGPWLQDGPQVGFTPATSSGDRHRSMGDGAGTTGPGCTCPPEACAAFITPTKLHVGSTGALGRGWRGGDRAWGPVWNQNSSSS